MTADRAAIRARLEAATQGPWTATTYEATMNDRSEYRFGATDRPQSFRAVMRYADADLISHAPADLRALLDENEQLAAKIARVEALIERAETDPNISVEQLRDALGGSEK